MKGLDLAENYFKVHGLPMIQEKFGDYLDRIAAGLAGPGSECFGYDDEISRDHDWGPGFCLWLTKEDYHQIGDALQKAYRNLPSEFAGFGPRKISPGEEGRVGVIEIKAFYQTYLGLDHPPQNLMEWLALPEQALAVCTNGKVFYDPSGIFTEWRNRLLLFYPEDIRIKKIASRCMTIGQSGQYNFTRSLQREDYFAVRYAEAQFCSDVLSLVFLLNKIYCPYYKWMHQAVKDLPILGMAINSKITEMIQLTDYNAKIREIENICTMLIETLTLEGLTDSTSDFLIEHAPIIQRKIKNPDLRNHFVFTA
jgi:hypothetical protein